MSLWAKCTKLFDPGFRHTYATCAEKNPFVLYTKLVYHAMLPKNITTRNIVKLE